MTSSYMYNIVLIDSRVPDIEKLLQSLNAETIGIVFQYNTDTYDSITDAIKNTLKSKHQDQGQDQDTIPIRVQAVGILQHNYKTPVYQFVASELESTLDNVVETDPQLETWKPFSDFIARIVSQYGVTALDLMACALYSNTNWKYVIDTLATGLQINIRASTDNTGAAGLNGNWFLEFGDINLKDVYFTDAIDTYIGLLIQSRIYIPDFYATYGMNTSTSHIAKDSWVIYSSVETYDNEGLASLIKMPNSYLVGFRARNVTIGINGPSPFKIDSIIWDAGGGVGSQRTAKDVKIYGSNISYLGNISSSVVANNATLITSVTIPANDSSNISASISLPHTTFYSSYYIDVLNNYGPDGSVKINGLIINNGAPSNTVLADNNTTPTLNWGSPLPNITNLSTGQVTVTATSESSGIVSYSSSNSQVAATGSGGTINLVGVGTATITASQAADPVRYYNAPANITFVMTVIRTPTYSVAPVGITKYYSDIGSTFTASSPANGSFNPALVSPTFTYGVSYLTNTVYATAYAKTAEFVTPSSTTCTVRGTGQCYLTATTNQDLVNFLDAVTVNVAFLTVRPGYIVGPNVNLTDAIIQNYDLSGTELSGVVLTNASIINCILDNVNMSSANFTGATFVYNRINSGTNFTGANFQNLNSTNISGTTALISSTWAIQSGRIVASGTILFALTFTMASASTISLGGSAGYYEITANTLLINGRAETTNVSTNIVVKAANNSAYVLTQTGITPAPAYKFTLYLNSTNNTFYVQARDILTNAITTLPYYAAVAQTFAVAFLVPEPVSPYRLLGSYIFGPDMSLDGVYFDNSINPKPDLTDLSFVNLRLSSSTEINQITLNGWNLTRARLNSGSFRNILFQNCICNATDFSGSTLTSSSFAISYDSATSAVPNTATLQNAKFTNASISGLAIAGYNNNPAVAANQMDVSGLDFSGCVIQDLKTSFLAGTPLRMKNAYDGPEYAMLTDSLIGRFIAGPEINLSNFTLGNAAFNGTNFAGANIYGTKLADTTMSGVRVSNGRLKYSSLTTTLPLNFKIVTPSLSKINSIQYTVTNSGTGEYMINNQPNPTIVLTRGLRYVFDISASGHPFWIKTAPTIGTGDAYTSGVTNNGLGSGIGVTTFIVPNDAPNTLYYKCEFHSSMGGTLTISDEINTYPTYIIGPGADLSGANAAGVIFTGANISGANFTNANFQNVVSGSLTTAPIEPTLPSAYYSLVGGYFVGPYVDLSGSYLVNRSLANTNLTGVNLANATLLGVTSGGISTTATISGVTTTVAPTLPTGYGFTGGYILGPNMNFTGADLSGFDFTNVNLSGTIFTGANITYVKSGNTMSSQTTLLPILPDASYVFLNNYLIGPRVNLSSKDLSGMQFYGLSLSGSIFTSANFSYADISGTIIDGANFTGATFTRTQSRRIPQPTVAPTFTAGTAGGYVVRNGYLIGANVDLSNVDFTGLDLSNTVLTNANLASATFTNTRSGGITFNALTPPVLPSKYKVVGGYLHGPRVDLSGANLASYDFSTPDNAINWSVANLTNATFTNMKSGWITIDSVGNDASGPILSSPYVYNRLVSANPLGGFIIGPRVSLNGATLTDYDLRNVIDITSVDFTNAALMGIKTSGSLVATPGSGPTFTPGSGYVLYAAAGRIIGPGVDLSGVDLSGRYFGTSAQAIAAGSTAKLSSINFTNANLTRASLYGSTITRTNFAGATFYRTRTGGLTYFAGEVFYGLTYAGFGTPTLPNPNEYTYVGTDAVTGSGGYIIGPGVDLSGTNLRGAAFVNTNFNDVDMSGAVITGSISDNVVYDASTALPFGYKFITNWEKKNFIAGPNISLSGKVLDAAIIADVDLTNTNFTNAGIISTTFVGTRSGGITYTAGHPPTFQSGSGYQIRSGYLVGPSVDLSNITAATISAGNGVAYGGGLQGVDLSGTNLASASFVGSDMSGVDLSGTILSYTDFNGANFINIKSGGRISFSSAPRLPSSSYSFVTNGYSEASPTSAFQRYIVGPGANCANADFSGAIFNRVDLSGVDFTNANFTRVSSGIMRNYPIMSALPTGYTIVIGTNTGSAISQDPSYNNAMYFIGPNVVLTNAYLASATITDCNVSGVDFTGADFTNMASARVTTSTINPAIMPDATYFIKSGYIFGPNVNLSGGDFTGLDLSGAVLTGAKFTSANFTGANLDGANITYADLSGSVLTGTKTARIVYQGYNLSAQDPSLPKPYRYVYSTIAGLGAIVGPYADLSGADLRGSNLGYANVTGTNLTGANLVGIKSGNCAIDNEVRPVFSTGSGFKFVSGYLIGPYANLTRNDFTDQDFSGTNLTGVDFTNSKLLNIKSGNIVASPALPIFPDSTFSLRGGYIIGPGVDLSNSDLSGIDLSNVTITNANMINSGFVNIKTGGVKGTTPYLKPKYSLRNGYIIGDSVDLSGADLSGQSLANAYFTNTNITNAVFTNSILSVAKSGGNMRYNDATKSSMPAKYTIRGTYILGPSVDVSGGNFTGLDISNTFLSGANLKNAVFTNTRSGGIQVLSDQPILFSDPAFYNSQYGYTYLNGYIVGPGVDLSGSDFSGVTISAVDISGANMTNARLTRIRSSDIAGQPKPGAITTGYKVTARHFIGPELDMSGYDFTNGDFSGADISGSDLTNAVFTNTLSGNVGGTPTSTKFTTTTEPVNIKYQLSLGYIVGPSVDLTNSDLSGVDVSGINLSGATFYNSKSGKVAHSSLTMLPTNYGFIGDYIVGPNVNLDMVDFSGADLRYTNLTNVNFGSANLYNVKSGNITGIPAQLPPTFSFVSGFIIGPGTDLSGADLSGGNLGGCNINGADLTNASFYNVLSGGVQGTPRLPLTAPYRITTNGYIVGPSVNLNGANFVSINMQGLTLTNAIMTNADFENAKFGGNIGVPRILTPPYIHVQTELSGGYIVGPRMDLSSANFTNANIATADLSGANLANAVFYRTRSGNMNPLGIPSALPVNYGVMSTTLSGGYLVGPNVDLTNANFTDSVLSNRNISGALMEGINFSNTHIGGGGLVGPPAALSSGLGYRFIQSASGGGYIIGPNIDLSGANFANTYLPPTTNVVGVNLTNVNFTNARTEQFVGDATLGTSTSTILTPPYRLIVSAHTGAYIIGPRVNIQAADFTDTDISNTDLTGVNLSNAVFTNMRSGLLTVTEAESNPSLPSGPNGYRYVTTDASGGYIVGPAVNLTRANLAGSDLSYVNMYGCDVSLAILPSSLTYVRSGMLRNSPAVLPAPYLFIPNDASGAYIVGPYSDLSGANLEGSTITGADISGTDFTNARLARLRSGGMVNAHPPAVLPAPYLFIPNDASGAYIVGPYSDLSGANLEGSAITGADISGTNFTNARLARLRSGGMVNAHPPAVLPAPYLFIPNDASGAYIVGPYSDLSGANLEGSTITGADISGADFTNARLARLRSGGMVNAHPPAALPAPYLFIPNDASGAYIVGPYSDLSGANLEGSAITGADISGADFTNARLARLRSGGMVNAHPPAVLPAPYLFIPNDASGAYIVGPYSDLSGATLVGSVITGADISGADFTNARLRNIRSGGLSINGPPAKLPPTYSFVVSAVTAYGGYIIGTGVDISNAVLTGTDLSGIVFTDAIMHGAQLAGASLVNARSGGIRGVPASLPAGYTFVNDNSTGGYIVGRQIDLSGADLTNCVLSGMDVSGANLTNAIMVNTRAGPALIGPPAAFPSSAYRYLVSGAIGGFIIGPSVDILGANLSGADLSGYNFIGVNVTGTDFSGANLVNIRSGKTVGPPARLSSPYVFMTDNSAGGFIVGPRVDLTGANLTNCQFTGLDISGATFTNAILTNVRSGGGMIGPPAANTLPAKYRYVEDATDGTGGYFVGPGVDLSGALLRNMPASYLQGAYFTNTNITNARLSGSGLFYVKSGGMVGAPASLPTTYSYVVSASGGYIIGPYADLSGANLNNTVLTGMNIAHADFTSATFIGTRTGGLVGPPETLATNYYYIQASSPGTVQDAYIVGPRVNLARAVLSRTNLKNVDLSGADFTNAVFEGTNFTNTNIRNAVLTGVAPFTNTQRLQLLKNSNNRNIVAAQVAQCLGGEIDIVAATSNTPNTHTYNPIFDYIRGQPVDVLTVDDNGNSNLSLYGGRAFYIPSAPGESFYVDATATVYPTTASSFTQYYYDEGRDSVIETLTGNTIRSVGIGGGSGGIPGSVQRVFMVFGGSVMGLVIDDVYNALGFPPIFRLYAYYGVRNLTLPSQISPVNTVIGNGQISLNWTASFSDGKPRLGYSIEYTAQEPVGNIYVPWTVYSSQYALTNATITGLTNGTTYYFRVAAINIVNRGPYSTVVQAVPGTVPDPIVNMFVNGSDNALTLEWTDPYNQGYAITGYSIRYRATTTVSAEFTTLSIPVSDTIVSSNILMDGVNAMRSYLIPIPIQNGTPYEVQIAAVNAVGRGAYRGSLGPIAGTAPGSIDAANIVFTLVVSGGGGKVRLSWYPPTSSGNASIYAYGIQVYTTTTTGSGAETTPADTWTWKTVSQTAYTVIPDTGRENALCAVIMGLVNGSGYRFRIAAISGVGRGTYSNAVPSPTASAIIAGSTPAVLTTVQMGYTIDTATGGMITLAWAKPKSNGYAVSAYKVRTRPLSSDPLNPNAWVETPVIEVPPNEPATLAYRRRVFNTGLINGTEYEFQVSARNQLGWSEFSETLIGIPRSVPDAPAVITATSLDTAARVEWSGGINTGGYPITGYQVQYKLNTSSTWSVPINIEGVYNTSTIISNLVNGRTYMVRAFRKNAIGYSLPTSSASVVPGVRAAPPIGLVFSVGPSRITLYWKPPIDTGTNQVLYYYVQYKVATAPETSYEYLKDTPQSDPTQVTSTTIEYDEANTLYYTAGIEGANLLTNGTQYSVRVAAVTTVGIGAYSDPILAIPGTVPAQVS